MSGMVFSEAALLAQYIAKEYSAGIFRLLSSYRDISASEAASRLNMHIRTIQDYFDVMASYGILEKREVKEGKRPYYRYTLVKDSIDIHIDLPGALEKAQERESVGGLIREKKRSGARYSMARQGDWFSSVGFLEGSGRSGSYRRISLTKAQGLFLYNLPFPDAVPLTVKDIMKKAGVDEEYLPEIRNLIDELIALGIIELITPA